MFKHRLSKFGKSSLFAMCMLLVGGSFLSCQDWLDDYKYDDEEPKWLGASIYDLLKDGTPGHTYNNFVELIDSLGEKETLAHTGSKTLFVADDSAFVRFYENNPWGVKSISEMTKAQMKIVLYNAMLDNALLLDMMASTGATSSHDGQRLRRTTSISVIDSIPNVDANFMEHHPGWPSYNTYWDILRGKERTESMRLAMDGTDAMMVHFLSDYLKTNSIKVSDIQFLFKTADGYSKTYAEGDALVFANKIVPSGIEPTEFSDDTLTITCKNGYIYRLDNVLLPPSNMAEELRRRADTKVFSHLLDRFCVPVYDASLTAKYQAYYKTNDSIFRLRYFSKKYTENALLANTNSNPLPDELLNFDPGWNALTSNDQTTAEQDMAAMFVPRDEVMYEYFTNPEGGRFMVDYFAPEVEIKDIPSLLQALDKVPQVNIAAFLNNMLKSSFQATVASKFDKVTNDANDPIGLGEQHVDECVIANNGVIYILNNVFAPASFESVYSPTLVYENMRMMRAMIKQLRYDYYLLSMLAKYSFIIPDDNHFVYFDPVTVSKANMPASSEVADAYIFHYNDLRPQSDSTTMEFWFEKYKFDHKTYIVGGHVGDTTKFSGDQNKVGISGSEFSGTNNASFMKNRMTDLLEYLIIVHDEDKQNPENERFNANKKYYMTKGYGTIKVDATDFNNIKIYGGEQIENGTTILVKKVYDNNSGVTNGITYCTVPEKTEAEGDSTGMRYYSGIPTPPTKSVYTNLTALASDSLSQFSEFYNLCSFTGARVQGALKKAGATSKEFVIGDSLKYYQIFYTSNDKSLLNSVPFFNTYHYTVYVPTSESVQELYAQGFPSWADVEAYSKTAQPKAASMLRMIHKLVRYHFQDNSVYHDAREFSVPSPDGTREYQASYATSLINAETGRFYETVVKSAVNNSTIIVKDGVSTDDENTWARVVNTPGEENVTWNVMCRDIVYSGTNIGTSSYSVIQPINRPLLNDGFYGYDGRFSRFASNGGLVDTLLVKDGRDGFASEIAGDNCYLVSRNGKLSINVGKTADGKRDSLVTRETVYLMNPINEASEAWHQHFTREELVLVDDAPVLTTADGLLLIEETEMDGSTKIYKYKYATKENAEGVQCRILVNNAGEEIGLVPINAAGK